jgi:hypothetical protein
VNDGTPPMTRYPFLRVSVSAMLIALALTSAPVRAQSADYREVSREALSEFQEERWAEARVLLQQLYELRPSGEALRLLGAASYELGDYLVAMEYFERALAENQRPLSPALRVEATEGIAAAERFVGTVVFEVRPAGVDARIRVEGSYEIYAHGATVRLGVGPHRVVAEAAGYRTTESVVNVRGAESHPLVVRLEPLEAAVPEDTPTQLRQSAPLQTSNPYLLEPPDAQSDTTPSLHKPNVGRSIAVVSIGGLTVVAGTAMFLSSGANNAGVFGSAVSLLAAGGVFLTVGGAVLSIRRLQRRRWTREQAQSARLQYGFAPIIAPQLSLYGVEGMVSF